MAVSHDGSEPPLPTPSVVPDKLGAYPKTVSAEPRKAMITIEYITYTKWHRTASHGIARNRATSHGIAWHRMASHDIAWHRLASHDIARHRTTSPGIGWASHIGAAAVGSRIGCFKFDEHCRCQRN